ncbi:MAG: hypothetical protein JXA33_02605, partial [Anaerolineae bacterium]|nr:hypothetical protein [Anaerolineae bacterium]
GGRSSLSSPLSSPVCYYRSSRARNRWPPPLSVEWQPSLRLLLTTAAFTLIILGLGAVVNMGMRMETTMANRQLLTGLIGILGMAVAVAPGVWVSSGSASGAKFTKSCFCYQSSRWEE